MIKAGFYQTNPIFGDKDFNIGKVVNAIESASVDIIVLPEFFATGYQFASMAEVARLSEPIPDGETTKEIIKLSAEKGIYIIAGLPEKSGEKYYNSAIITGPDGLLGTYRKTHLFFEEKLFFSSGDTGFKIWDTKIGRIGIMICFDWFFPESMRTLALRGAELIAHPANLVLPYCPHAMPFRCLENRVYAITANRAGAESRKNGQTLRFIGMSQIVSPQGEVLSRASGDNEELLTVEIDLDLARNKSINPYNDLFKDRKPEMYSL